MSEGGVSSEGRERGTTLSSHGTVTSRHYEAAVRGEQIEIEMHKKATSIAMVKVVLLLISIN